MVAAALPVSLPLPVSQSKSRAELTWGRSEEYKESAAFPVPNHHHDELELLGLTVPKNSCRRGKTGKSNLFAVLFFSGIRGEGSHGWWTKTKWTVSDVRDGGLDAHNGLFLLFVTEAMHTGAGFSAVTIRLLTCGLRPVCHGCVLWRGSRPNPHRLWSVTRVTKLTRGTGIFFNLNSPDFKLFLLLTF
jgi:hypothetical protein